MPELQPGHRASVAAPATSANLGPAFDSCGLALDLRDEVDAEVVTQGFAVDVEGEAADSVALDESHLVVRSMLHAFDRMHVVVPGLRLRCRNRIPHGRGLGSSAAAIVSGLRLATALAPSSSAPSLLELAAEIEGHPDNVAACLLGGLTVAWKSGSSTRAVRLDVHPDVSAAALIPPEPVSTELARGLLPTEVSHADASANAGRAALLVAALTTRPELLFDATEDRLHQRYRRSAMPASVDLVDRMRAAGMAAVISGAGPTVLALSTDRRPADLDAWAPPGWRTERLRIDSEGAAVSRRD